MKQLAKTILHRVIYCLLAAASSSCSTTTELKAEADQSPEKAKSAGPAFYILKEGDKVENKLPLPNKTQIMVNWTYSDGSKKSKEGFRGWDMDHDGRFDMLEVVDVQGQIVSWAYDFDGDGVIDAIENAKPVQVSAQDLRQSEVPVDETALDRQ
jgi:hypothetical protein